MRTILLRLLSCVPALAVVVSFPPAGMNEAGEAQAQDGPVIISSAELVESLVRKTEVVSSQLDALHRIDILSRAAGDAITAADAPSLPAELQAAINTGMLRLDGAGRVQVSVALADGADVNARAAELAAMGMQIETVSDEYDVVQGMLPIPAIEAAAALGGVLAVTPPERPVLQTGTVTTEGDAALRANQMRALFAVKGENVRVGVISDGIDNADDAQASGDLPDTINISCDFGPGGLPTATGAGDEGTAMLEIVHDIAPNAELWFGHFGLRFGGTSVNMNEAVDCLAQSVDVIIDDVGFFADGIWDGTGTVPTNASTELNKPANRIRGYYTSVGNSAQRHYEEPYLDSGFTVNGPGMPPANTWKLHRYQGTANTTDDGASLLCPSPIDCGDQLVLAPGGSFTVFLQWNDPWGNSTNDYDLLVYDTSIPPSGGFILASAIRQTGAGSNPLEAFAFTNTSAASKAVFIAVGNYNGAAAVRNLEYFISQCSGCSTYPSGAIHNFNTTRGSVAGNSDAGGGVMSLGAINQADPDHDTIESFSSRGPTNDNRTKPETTGIDGVTHTGAGGFPVPFFGTSAASPHAGAIAALLLSCKASLRQGEPGDNPAADRTALRNALMDSAVDLGTAGIDNTFGAGRLDADTAAFMANCSPDQDGDGCTTAQENGPDHVLGGDRNFADFWDFFDVNGDRQIDLSDALDVLGRFGEEPDMPSYNPIYDRYSPNLAKPWQTALGLDGFGIDLTDALTSLASFGDECSSTAP